MTVWISALFYYKIDILTLSFLALLKLVCSSDLVATPSRPWKRNLEPRLPFEAKVPSRKAKAGLMPLIRATRKKNFTV